ncbi:phosphatidylserine/phosphatidylglycerophosphate/cardiolipin synthase-like enzyme [Friedmanniella endophytica]|uniref:Phosphatidylserine/phosphatidylglycerophosphate/ cardiolipin synthase-like enzyme n=1 Tax=Microlunatus kandeliicorticis TaxID=1759536 RepID=A0A7W3P7E8_9ACTN|nr:phospholipase D-like domain-containing protein [Microlunatus kandeliicorticis]MBA8795900.1 phosphatidylserine/phosphatidylglycerophosphate/cardiolipin synthase-like enzyme [Microlunatus kandeliicorticis]
MTRLEDWLLTKRERANARSVLDARHPGQDAWSHGNHVRPLIHGATYFAELKAAIEATRDGDLIYFTDWRGDPDQRLTDDPDSVARDLLAAADQRGVDVRGLIWRSHLDKLSFSAEQNRQLGLELQARGAEALLDMRVRTLGSHHQKMVVIRYADHPADDVAFVGGIDLCHSRRDDAEHRGDPQPQAMAPVYGPTPAWHDVQVAIHGPAVHDVERVFRERWLDPTPLSRNPVFWLHDLLTGTDLEPDPLPPQADPPPPVPQGTHVVQLLRTYPNLRHGRDYPFARGGERSVARGYSKALARSRQLVYIEDQYLWSVDVARAFVGALRSNPELRVIAVLPRVPDQSAPLSRVPQQWGRAEALALLREAGGDRVAVYSIENHVGRPVYVHAKVCVMDDVWATVGSDNFNRRSWTHDSELSAVVIDEAEPVPDGLDLNYARRLRLTLAAEHLDREVGPARFPGDTAHLLPPRPGTPTEAALDAALLDQLADCVDPADAFETFAASARRLEAWHAGGMRGPRPAGRLRPIPEVHFSAWTRRWADVMYRRVHDPDGRPRVLRQRRQF